MLAIMRGYRALTNVSTLLCSYLDGTQQSLQSPQSPLNMQHPEKVHAAATARAMKRNFFMTVSLLFRCFLLGGANSHRLANVSLSCFSGTFASYCTHTPDVDWKLLHEYLADARFAYLLVLSEILAVTLGVSGLRLTRAVTTVLVNSVENLVDLSDSQILVQTNACLDLRSGFGSRSRSRLRLGGSLREDILELADHALRTGITSLLVAECVAVNSLVNDDLAAGIVKRDPETGILTDTSLDEDPVVKRSTLVLVSRILEHKVRI